MDCATFTIVNDNLVEGNHGFSVTITNVGTSAMIGMPDTTFITINDDDGKLLILLVSRKLYTTLLLMYLQLEY